MIPMLRIAGIVLILTGLLTMAVTIFNAKRKGELEALKELERIRESGYTKEHQSKKRTEDVYRKEPVSDNAARMSRRAKRVRQRLQEDEKERAERPGMEPGTSAVEEVTAGRKIRKTDAPKVNTDGSGNAAAINTAAEAETDILVKEEDTGLLQPAEQKAKNVQFDSEAGTDILDKSEKTAGISWSEEDTGILPTSEEATGVLRAPSEDATDILPEQERGMDILELAEKGTDILVHSENDTDILPNSEKGTDILLQYEEKK